MTLKWEPPPDVILARRERPRRPWGEYATIAAKLRRAPNRWALIVEDGNASTANSIRAAGIAAFRPAGSFDAVGQQQADGSVKVWARYVGEPD